MLYISHRIAEIFEICDRVTILRDGSYVNTFHVSEVTPRQIVEGMVGRELNDFYPAKSTESGESLLEVRDLCRYGVFQNISFELRRGEILGLSGLVGSGRTEVARAICAIDKLDEGEVRFLREPIRFKNYSDAIKHGLCYLTEDRKQQGLFLNLNVKNNINAAIIDTLSRHMILQGKKEVANATAYVQRLNIKVHSVGQLISSLSGGNQQKAMIAKWLSVNPSVIIDRKSVV